jgi:thiol-disulfide isomerase/thioredoxin
MKRIIKPISLFAAISVVAFTVYYWYVISSAGSDKIRYIEDQETYNSFSDIVNHPDLKGKVIYVDYWHTGCSPCLEEFALLPALKEEFRADDDLVFLYLGKDRSVPGEKFRWKKMIEKKNLTGTHYFMSSEKFEQLWMETVKDTSIMQAFPHHLIVDRDGSIINNNAPRPGNDTLVSELIAVLQNSTKPAMQ